MAGDTRLSIDRRRTSNPFTGSLKVNIITRDLCVRFAGKAHTAESTIRELSSGGTDLTDTLAVIDVLLPATEMDDVGRSAEFLVIAFDGNEHSITRLAGGGVHTPHGDAAGSAKRRHSVHSKNTRRPHCRSRSGQAYRTVTRWLLLLQSCARR